MTNIVVIEGRLLHDPELSKTNTARSVCTFTIICNTRGPKGPKEIATCEAWDNDAENLCKYLHVGDRLTVTGYLHSKHWENPIRRSEDIYRTVVSVRSLSFGDNRKIEEEVEKALNEKNDKKEKKSK